MTIWETLGIEPTRDVRIIRQRYAELVRLYHPEDQPETYQKIVQAYQEALSYARSSNETPKSSFGEASLSYDDGESSEDFKEKIDSSLDFETIRENQASVPNTNVNSSLDFSGYHEAAYMIKSSIESIIGNEDYSLEEQENLWQQLFHYYGHNIDAVKMVLEELDVYIFDKPEQFSIIIPLLEDYIPDYKYWGYYYKLKHWKVKRATAYKNGESPEAAKKETAKLYASYRLCQALLEDSQKANQIGVWITFFKQSFSPGTVLFLLNSSKQMITSIPVLAYILEKIKPEVGEEDQKAYDELVAYFEELKADTDEPVDIHPYNLLNPSEVEEVLYLLVYSSYRDDDKLVQDWSYLFDNVKDKSLLLQLLEEIDVYPFTNDKALDIVFRFVENHIKDKENPYLKKFIFWKMLHAYPSVIKEYGVEQKEKFDYWYYEGYLFVDQLLKDDKRINDWSIWKQVYKEKPRIYPILFEQIYKEYHRFTDGELLKFVLTPFPTSKIAPQIMNEETDKRLEEMTAYAYKLCHPKSKKTYLVLKKRQSLKNKILKIIAVIFTIFSLLQTVQERLGANAWVYAGMISLFYFYMLQRRQTFIEEGVTARGMQPKFYHLQTFWVAGIILLDIISPFSPLGLIATLSFVTFFSLIDGFQMSQRGQEYDSLTRVVPAGIFLASGFLSNLLSRGKIISDTFIIYVLILLVAILILFFTKLRPGFPPSAKEVLVPMILGILLFRLVPYFQVRVDFFDPVILRQETLTITFILLLNGLVLSYFKKQQRSMVAVRKIYMVYGLQIFIFLRRLFRILFGPIFELYAKQIEPDVLLMNSEFAFYFLEMLFILILLLLVRNIRKENSEVLG